MKSRNLRALALELKKLCHDKNCDEPRECPRTHCGCEDHLDTQTAIAWVLAEQLIHFCDWINHPKAELVKTNLGGICAFAFQVMGQHQEDNWFRSDIFSLVDWIDHLFDVGAYETEEI